MNTNNIDLIGGNDVVEEVHFQNGEMIRISGLFVAVGVAGSIDLAKKNRCLKHKGGFKNDTKTNCWCCDRRIIGISLPQKGWL